MGSGRGKSSPLTLTEAGVAALRPRKTAYDVRDGKLTGFDVRVLPSGRKRFFVHCQHRGQRGWKIVADAGATDVRQARSLAVAMLATIRRGEDASCHPDEPLFEVVAETVFERHERVWKARTMSVNRGYLRKQILPHGPCPSTGAISASRSCRTSPGAGSSQVLHVHTHAS